MFDAEAEVGPDEGLDIVLKDEDFEDFGLIEPEEVDVADDPGFGREVGVGAEVEELQAGIDEIGLALLLAGAEIGNEAEALLEVYTEELDLLAVPEAENAAAEVGIVENCVEAGGFLVAEADIGIAACEKVGSSEANPVAVVRELGGKHLGID